MPEQVVFADREEREFLHGTVLKWNGRCDLVGFEAEKREQRQFSNE